MFFYSDLEGLITAKRKVNFGIFVSIIVIDLIINSSDRVIAKVPTADSFEDDLEIDNVKGVT